MTDTVKLLTVANIVQLINAVGIDKFMLKLSEQLHNDFVNWPKYNLSARHATHYPHGVIELMPFTTEHKYSFKYVNGHPNNPQHNKQTVVAFGALADVATGYPLMISEMTLLTALRTAVTSAIASKSLARNNTQTMAMIGTGAQSEFQALAHYYLVGVKTIRYFDIDQLAMEKFAKNLSTYDINLVACNSVEQAVDGVDIITTATADKTKARIINASMLTPGVHLNAIGGDCPGKIELDPDILNLAKVVVEHLPQSKLEGEIQSQVKTNIHAELWEILAGIKSSRDSETEITLFDSVGFSMEDYSILDLVYNLSAQYEIGDYIEITPKLDNSKDLFGLLY